MGIFEKALPGRDELGWLFNNVVLSVNGSKRMQRRSVTPPHEAASQPSGFYLDGARDCVADSVVYKTEALSHRLRPKKDLGTHLCECIFPLFETGCVANARGLSCTEAADIIGGLGVIIGTLAARLD